MRPQLSEQDYLKMHAGKNDVHELDREKASSVIKNIVISRRVMKESPYFNKRTLPL